LAQLTLSINTSTIIACQQSCSVIPNTSYKQ